ncbi:MAG: DUF839 domain-containing protein [Nitrococcus sp.]|nr:DUF839 domain-containing protein [Nitrococcus sp.]
MEMRKVVESVATITFFTIILTSTSIQAAGFNQHSKRWWEKAPTDFGEHRQHLLQAHSWKLFGFGKPLKAPADTTIDRRPNQPSGERQLLARGLQSEFVARNVAFEGDMIAFWPNDLNYTHLIVCIEQGREENSGDPAIDGENPSIQRINVTPGPDYGKVETILYGMDRCDGIRTTPWGTVLATEETDDGGAYEIIDPLGTTNHWIADRGAAGAPADIRDGINSSNPSSAVVKRTALPAMAWEGLAILHNGVVIAGDELRPELDKDGGAIFRFVPSAFYNCTGAPVRPDQLCDNTIADLQESPLVSGQNYALATLCDEFEDFGQGCEAGRGVWIEVGAATAREDANQRGATGYCRPEDLHVDPGYGVFVGGEGIRWYWNNTCGAGTGETLRAVGNQMDAQGAIFSEVFGYNLLSGNGTDPADVRITRFVGSDSRMFSPDNLDIQPFTKNVYVIEDHEFGEIWACLPDGGDRDGRTDGCVAMLSINSSTAEPTGFIFDGTGKVAFYIVQHGQGAAIIDFESNPVCEDDNPDDCNGYTDDLIKITGFKVKKALH